ncbi:MAG TPA: DUF1878 family protein [Bacilli bacterium]|nr:DUF1878 family protein [Bacilli bacterium]
MDLDKQIGKVEFYQRLLAEMVSEERFSFYRLVIEKGLSEAEMQEVIQVVTELDQQFEEQKEMGYIHFSSLLVHFAGMLNPKLKPYEAIQALKSQGICVNLMETLMPLAYEATLWDKK